MRRRSKSPSRIKDASLGGHHRPKPPSGIRLKTLLFTSGQRPISIPIPRSRTRRREHDPAHRLHDDTNARDEPLRYPVREGTILHTHHPQSDRDSFKKPQSTLVAQHEEYQGQDTANLFEYNDESDTVTIMSDPHLGGDLRERSEDQLSEQNIHPAVEAETTNVSCPKLDLNDHMDSGSNSDAVDASQQEVIHPEDAKHPEICHFEDDSAPDSDPDSDVEFDTKFHLEPDLESDHGSDLDSDHDSDHDSAIDFDGASIAASQNEDIGGPLKTSISALDISLLDLKLVAKPGTTHNEDFRPGDIVWVSFKRCPSCPEGTKWCSKQHEREYHRGQKRCLVISNVIPRDGTQGPSVEGFSCTSLRGRGNLSSNQMKARFLRLQGGRNDFWSSIKNGEGVSSGEKADLVIQGPAEMRLETYVERKDPKCFPVGQLKDFPKRKPSRHRLEPESLELLLECTTRS